MSECTAGNRENGISGKCRKTKYTCIKVVKDAIKYNYLVLLLLSLFRLEVIHFPPP